MKKILVCLLALFGTAAIVSAQPGGGIRRTPEERAAVIHHKLDSAFKLEANTLAALDTALVALYKAQDAKRQEMMAGGSFDRDAFMEEMKKFNDAQNEMLKAVLTKDQYEIWKEKIQPAMRPQRQGGGGPPGGGN
jgi:periplasmic protein CpxP/Spy